MKMEYSKWNRINNVIIKGLQMVVNCKKALLKGCITWINGRILRYNKKLVKEVNMNGRYCLSPQEQKMATDLARYIYQAKGICPDACESFWHNRVVANAIMDYWNICNNEETNFALNRLLAFMCVRHLQKCWLLECNTHPEMEN